MRNVQFFIALALVTLMLGCIAYHASGVPDTLSINADIESYTPLMSSTVGIGLTPSYPSDIDNGTVAFRWHADYGHFISWAAPDSKVNILGPAVTTDDKKIYWSYNVSDMDKDKPPAHITLSMIDQASGRTINTTGLDIIWENRHVARVKK